MADGLIAVTTIFAFLSTSATLAVTVSKFVRDVRSAPGKFKRLFTEIVVLRDVVDECYGILDRSDAPRHVRDSLISCFESGKEVEALAHQFDKGITSGGSQLRASVKLVLKDDELTKTAAVFRERVVLLRDMCSE